MSILGRRQKIARQNRNQIQRSGKILPPCCASFKSQRDSDEAGGEVNGQATQEREGSCLPSNPLVAEDLSRTG